MIENILFISKQFGDEHDGITAYLSRLFSMYSEKKIQLKVMTARKNKNCSGAKVIELEREWNLFALPELTKVVKESEADLINLHYMPQIYAKFGMSLAITLWLLYSRVALGKRVVISFHEVYEPFSLRSFWRLPIALLSRIQFFLFLMIAHQVTFTTPVHRARVIPFFPFWKQKMHFIPVFSNIDYLKMDDSTRGKVREKWGIHSEEVVLGLFSKTLHSELKIETMLEVARGLKEKGVVAKVLLVGALRDSNALEFERLEAMAKEKEVNLIWTGALAAKELSECLQMLDYYLFLSPDGVSPRSSALMAAFQHEANVITVPSPQMNAYPEFEESVTVLKEGACEEAVKVIAEGAEKKDSGAFYQRHFSPKAIADAVMSIFERAC